jgi:hypothetical protein
MEFLPLPARTLWLVVPGGGSISCHRRRETPSTISIFPLEKSQKIFDARKGFGDALSVSPDGRWLLYAQQDQENTDIMLVENFR